MKTIDVAALKAYTDCRTIAESLLGQPKKRAAERSLWHCPFHNEQHPSFWVYDNGWTCYGQCATSGSVLDLVMGVKGLDFKGACEYLGGSRFQTELARSPQPVTRPDPEPPSPDWQAQAWGICEQAQQTLWSPQGEIALKYLTQERGLEAWVIKLAGLGYIPRPKAAVKAQKVEAWLQQGGLTIPCGITMPSLGANGVLWGVRVRLPAPPGYKDKYRSFMGGKLLGSLFFGGWLLPSQPVLVDEGELNALAIVNAWQDFEQAPVAVALSGVNNSLSQAWLNRLLFAPVVYVRTDRGTGDNAAQALCALSSRFRRVQVPDPYKDPNELLAQAGKPALLEWLRSLPPCC